MVFLVQYTLSTGVKDGVSFFPHHQYLLGQVHPRQTVRSEEIFGELRWAQQGKTNQFVWQNTSLTRLAFCCLNLIVNSPCPTWFPWSSTRLSIPTKFSCQALKMTKPSLLPLLEFFSNDFFTTFFTNLFGFWSIPLLATTSKNALFYCFSKIQSLVTHRLCKIRVSTRIGAFIRSKTYHVCPANSAVFITEWFMFRCEFPCSSFSNSCVIFCHSRQYHDPIWHFPVHFLTIC